MWCIWTLRALDIDIGLLPVVDGIPQFSMVRKKGALSAFRQLEGDHGQDSFPRDNLLDDRYLRVFNRMPGVCCEAY